MAKKNNKKKKSMLSVLMKRHDGFVTVIKPVMDKGYDVTDADPFAIGEAMHKFYTYYEKVEGKIDPKKLSEKGKEAYKSIQANIGRAPGIMQRVNDGFREAGLPAPDGIYQRLLVGEDMETIKTAYEKKDEPVEAEVVEGAEEPEYNPFPELIHAQTEEEGGTELSADELEFYSTETETPAEERPSFQEWLEGGRTYIERLENLNRRYDAAIEKARELLEKNTEHSGARKECIKKYQEISVKVSEMHAQYDHVMEKAHGIHKVHEDIKRAMIQETEDFKEQLAESSAIHREIAQYHIDRINRNLENAKEILDRALSESEA